MREAFVGFDSAWGGKKGGLAWVTFEDGSVRPSEAPVAADFNNATEKISELASNHEYVLLAIDQPTIVRNQTGSRPVDCVARSLITSRLHSSVQPANRRRESLFGPNAPIWNFLEHLGQTELGSSPFRENPGAAITEDTGRFLVEVYPALTLPVIVPETLTREVVPNRADKGKKKPVVGYAARYNPSNKSFRKEDWEMVANGVAERCAAHGLGSFEEWVRTARGMCDADPPKTKQERKATQDQLDAVICLLVAVQCRYNPIKDGNPIKDESIAVIGDAQRGYMLTPVSEGEGGTKGTLARSAVEHGVSFSNSHQRWATDVPLTGRKGD